MTKEITGPELERKLTRGERLLVLEALPQKYYRKAHIPGAINFPLEDAKALASKVAPDKSEEIVVYCANSRCENSHIVAGQLRELGYQNVAVYPGGKEDWIRLGFGVATGFEPGKVA